MRAGLDLMAGPARAAGVRRVRWWGGLAVHGLRQHAGRQQLADPLLAVKQQGMGQALAAQCGLTEPLRPLLADDGVKRPGVRPGLSPPAAPAAAAGQVEQELAAGIHSAVFGVQKDSPDLLADGRAAGLARLDDLVAERPEASGESMKLRGLAAAFDPLEAQEKPSLETTTRHR